MIGVLDVDESNGFERLKVGTYFRLTLGSRKMLGCMDIGLATLQDIKKRGPKPAAVCVGGGVFKIFVNKR